MCNFRKKSCTKLVQLVRQNKTHLVVCLCVWMYLRMRIHVWVVCLLFFSSIYQVLRGKITSELLLKIGLFSYNNCTKIAQQFGLGYFFYYSNFISTYLLQVVEINTIRNIGNKWFKRWQWFWSTMWVRIEFNNGDASLNVGDLKN